MPAFAPITPVAPIGAATVLEPNTNVGGIATYVGSTLTGSGLTVALAPVVSVSVQRPSRSSKISKVRQKLVMPTEGQASGVPNGLRDREVVVDIIVTSDSRSTDDERNIAILSAINLVTSADKGFNAVFKSLKSIY